MRHLVTHWMFFSLVIVTTFAIGQISPSNAKPNLKPPRPEGTQPGGKTSSGPSEPDRKTSGSDFGTNLANTVVNTTSDPDDHVPCFFTLKQLMDLRPVPSVPKLNEADQSRVLTSVVEAVDTASDKELTRDQKAKFIAILAGEMDGKLIGKTPGEALATIMNILYEITAKNADLYDAAADEERLLEMLPKYGATSAIQKKAKDQSGTWFKQNDRKSTLSGLASVVAPDVPELASTLDQASSGQNASAQLNGAVVDSARSAINKFARPTDIGCAYQILSWNESRLLFGRSVANDFIGVQVTVRNLNGKEEFIVHNAMLSADTDIHGAIGRYFEGADKISVEAYNNAGESLTARGIVGNSIAAASTLLSVLQPIVSVDNFNNVAASFSGGVVPGWKTLSPDHQKEQLLLIANSGFSATYTTKTVVGKSGAATFYTWFPAKPFLEGWWVQDCAQSIATVGDPTAGSASPPQVGVDLQRARNACQSQGVAGWKTIPYQKWSSISDQLFRDLSLAVVAGIHVQEDSKNKSSVTDVKCPNNSQGELDLSKASADGTISCDVAGDNLDKVAKLRLENASNAVDPIRPEANVTVSGDNTTGKAAFKVSDLASASGNVYNVYAVGKDGTETSTGQTIHLDSKTVTLSAIKPDTIGLGNRPSKVELTGYHLNNLTSICLTLGPLAEGETVAVVKDSATQATIIANSLKISQGSWHIYLGDCAKQPADSGKVFNVTGAATPVIDSFSPTAAAVGGTVTINGSNLTGATEVTFGGPTARPAAVTDKKVTVIVPPGAKSGPIGVTTPAGTGSKDGFKVLAKAKVAAHSKTPGEPPK
jgi:hypothetical protein